MGALFVTCPYNEKKKKFSTGVQIDRDSFNLVQFHAVVTAHCPYCKKDYTWRYRDTEYLDIIPPKDWIENR